MGARTSGYTWGGAGLRGLHFTEHGVGDEILA